MTKRRFTKYPSGYVKAARSWGKISTNPDMASLIVDITRFLKNHEDVDNVSVTNNGDIQFYLNQGTAEGPDYYPYYLKIYKH